VPERALLQKTAVKALLVKLFLMKFVFCIT
jgi:hypothetical protein